MSDGAASRVLREERVVLRDGSTVHIRPIAPDDRGALAAAFEKLSPETRNRRFLAPVKRLDSQMLRYLTNVDHVCHEALVAVEPDNGEVVGIARYVSLDTYRPEAEVAMVVADGWRGRGLATVLLSELTTRALANGIERFVAICLNDNEDALDVLGSLGSTTVAPDDSGLREVDIELSAPDSAKALRRALGHASREDLTFLPLAHPEAG